MHTAKVCFAGESSSVSSPVFCAFMLDLPEPDALLARYLDTGPPEGITFAEMVLQRSLLTHAPPPMS
jgi:hypothetical protein